MSETLSSGLTITIPTLGETNWDQVIKISCFQKISEHDHTGGGKGVQIATGAIVADAVNDLKILLRNSNYLRARNAANSADIGIIGIDGSDNTEIKSVAGRSIEIIPAGGHVWTFQSAGHQVPVLSSTYDIGTSSLRVRVVYGLGLKSGDDDLTLENGGATRSIVFRTNSTDRWYMIPAGHLNPAATSTYDIGSATIRVRDVYTLGVKSGDDDLVIANGGAARTTVFRTNNTDRWYMIPAGHLDPAADNTYDIGDATHRLRALYAASILGMTYSNWTPTLGASAGTFVSLSTVARQMTIGKQVSILIEIIGTPSTTPTELTFTLPSNSARDMWIPVRIINAGTEAIGIANLTAGSNVVAVRRPGAGAVWTAGAGNGIFSATFTYESA